MVVGLKGGFVPSNKSACSLQGWSYIVVGILKVAVAMATRSR